MDQALRASASSQRPGLVLIDLLFEGRLSLAVLRFLIGCRLVFPLPITEGVYFALFSVTPPGPSPPGPPSILIFSLISSPLIVPS